MKIRLIWISILLIILGCELIPEAVEPPADESVKKEYLQPGDTLEISIESLINENSQNGMFSFKDLGDSNIVTITQIESMLIVIGKNFGSTTITAQFNNADKNQIIYLNFIVLEGFPVFNKVGEEIIIKPAEYFESLGEIEPDSIYLVSEEEITSFTWRNDNNQNLVLTGIRPGTHNVVFSVRDSTDIHEVYLTIETSVRQVVMGEVFTNVGCIPCVPVNHELDVIIDEQQENITMIRYHWNSPLPLDPMYDYNPNDVEWRRTMYDVPFCPVVVINGSHILFGQAPVENNANSIVLSEIAQENNLYLGHTVNLIEDSILVDIEVYPFSMVNDIVKVWAFVVEDSINYSAPNGELIHMQVMRDLNSGDEWDTLEENETYSSQISLLKPDDYTIDHPLFHVITLVQSVVDNRVFQSNRLHAPLENDAVQ